ncbi:hypothetical protein [Mesorhizobium sp. WSM3876]|uniref:hypothetical protein n=2 Tax=Phyllobacteriaceae TaxID=69277 RepID=UPI001FE1A487|nr:hypothetical protein [Mesorhizobium sp. WSM3876]
MHFPDLTRPKQAAKYLVRASTGLKLATVHEALARALGYRDWHELSITSHPNALAAHDGPDLDAALLTILDLADALGLPDGHVQYAVSRARLLRATPWSIDEHMVLRASIWRRRVFGPPGRGKPGTVVKYKAYDSAALAYLRYPGRPTHLLFDTGFGMRADFEVATPRTALPDFVPSRIWLPYGLWQLTDGLEVAFSRDYLPMWRISNDGTERLAPWLWIKDIAEEKHFASGGTAIWASGAARDSAVAYLQQHRISELPMLTDIMPHLFEPQVESLQDGVARLCGSRGDAGAPPYAKLNDRVLA